MSPDTTAASYRLTPLGQALVEQNLGLVRWALTCTRIGENLDPDDRAQVACLALIEAVARFDHGRGYRFSTYAGRCILRVLLERSQTDGLIGVSRHAARRPSVAAENARRIGPLRPEPRAASDTFAHVSSDDRDTFVRRVVDSLPEPLPGVVWSRSRGIDRPAIARSLGLTESSVRTFEARAYRRLRPLLARLADGR